MRKILKLMAALFFILSRLVFIFSPDISNHPYYPVNSVVLEMTFGLNH